MKKGFACGVFDLFHAGHVLMLKECKENCGFLTVGLNSCKEIDYTINPNKNEPIFTIEQRKLILEACRYVDKVIVYDNETDLASILTNGQFDIRFLGEDYKGKPITSPNAVKEIFYNDRSHGMSTSLFRKILKY